MKSLLFLFFALPLFCGQLRVGILDHISDGDTVVMRDGFQKIHCRLEGIDSPEKFDTEKLVKDAKKCGTTKEIMQKAGEASSQYAYNSLKVGQKYQFEIFGHDPHQRAICRLYTPVHIGGGYMQNNYSFNEAIIEDGYAVVYQKGRFIKDERFKRLLFQAQQNAKSKNKGLWGANRKVMECINK